MSLASPSSCTPGQYYSYSPNFVSGDYTNSGATITAPNISLPGGIFTSYVKRALSFVGLQVTAVYTFTSVYNNFDVGGSIWNGGGICLSETASSPANGMDGISWVPHYLTGQWSLYHSGILIWEQTGLPHSVARTVTIYLTVSDVKIAGYYTLTMRLVSPTDGIDHTEVYSTFSSATNPTGNLFVNCDASGSTMTLSQLYITSPDSALGNGCDVIPLGLAHGFNSWISIFQDDSINGNTFTLPQPLHVDADNLKFEKEILIK